MAYRFRGTTGNDNIPVGAVGSGSTFPQTFTAWIRPFSDGENSAGVIQHIAISGSDAEIQRVFQLQSERAFQLFVRRPLTTAHQMISVPGILRFNVWQFVAATWRAAEQPLENGLYWGDLTTPPFEVPLQTKTLFSAGGGADTGNSWIGARVASTDNFDGDIAEVRLTNRWAFDLERIRGIWDRSLSPFQPFSSYWPLERDAKDYVNGTSNTPSGATLSSHVPLPRKIFFIPTNERIIDSKIFTETPTTSFGTSILSRIVQRARPVADITPGGWTNESDQTDNLYASLDEEIPSDADFVKSSLSPLNDEVIFALSPLQPPESRVYHILSVRYKKHLPAGQQIDLVIRLLEGEIERVVRTYVNISNDIDTIEISLTQAEMDSITNYEALRVGLRATTS